jgi:signal transduction histidine kinase
MTDSKQNMAEFSAVISHELKVPLTAIKGMMEILEENYGPSLDDKGQHLIQRISFNIKLVGEIIRSIEKLCLTEAKCKSEQKIKIGMGEVMQSVIENRKEQLENIEIQIADQIEPCFATPTCVYQLLDNLVANASNALRQVKNPKIRFGYESTADESYYFVEDNGPGIPVEQHDRIFDLFYRLESDQVGKGIGLFVAKRIVDHNDGKIWLSEGSYGGARFCFTIPSKA